MADASVTPIAPAIARRDADPSVVQHLEELLDFAKAGEISGLAIVATMDGRRVRLRITDGLDLADTIAGLEKIELQLLERI